MTGRSVFLSTVVVISFHLVGCGVSNVQQPSPPNDTTELPPNASPTTDVASDSQDIPDEISTPITRSDQGDATSVQVIAFEDIELPIQADIVFRPFMLTDRVKDLDGQRIRIDGYMLPDSKTKGIKQFVLLKNTECKFGPGGQADHLLNVEMVEGATAEFRDDPITIEGVLTINPFQGPDGNTWSIYDLACEKIEKFRPRR